MLGSVKSKQENLLQLNTNSSVYQSKKSNEVLTHEYYKYQKTLEKY